MENLSTYFCGNWKGFSAQQTLLALVESRKKSLDNKDFGGANEFDFLLLLTFRKLPTEVFCKKSCS